MNIKDHRSYHRALKQFNRHNVHVLHEHS